jgi:5'(3')-deoxyribonucleotidase
MDKPIIAIDIDEVLSPLHDLLFAHHNAVYGTNYQPRHSSGKYFISDFTGDNHKVTVSKLRRFVESEAFRNIEPLKGAVEAVRSLTLNFDPVVLTARQDLYEEVTHKWLKQHFPETFSQVHFTGFIVGKGLKKSKGFICREIGAAYLIDDNPDYCNDAADHGVQSLLFGDYPWNRMHTLHKNVIRCKDWDEVLDYFNARS